MQAVADSKSGQAPRKSANKLAALLKSPLAKSLMLGFFGIAAVQASFLFVLAFDVQSAERSAAREFDLLRSSQRVSHLICTAEKCISAGDLVLKNPSDTVRFAEYNYRINETNKESDEVISDFNKYGIDNRGVSGLKASFVELNRILMIVLKQMQEEGGDVKNYIRSVLDLTHGLYSQFVSAIKSVHKALGSGSENLALAGISPQIVLSIAAASNLVLALLMMFLVDKSITKPIRKLTSNCNKVISGEIIPKPEKVSNEIGSLEQAFYEMSLVVCENEKRRKSFLEFFQSVQTAALENVRACFDALLGESGLAERARKSIQKAKTNLATLMQLLQSMTEALSFKPDTSITPEYSDSSTSLLINNATSAIEALLQKRQIKLEVTDPACELKADTHLIGRVLVNFLSNAIKYSPDGDLVSLEVIRNGKLLKFRIKDNGPGISQENQQKLFKEFSQVESADGIKRAGTGLGLVICKQIVEAHGGKVGIESEVGKGSCFWFEIPTAPESKQPAAAQADTQHSAAPALSEEAKIKSIKRNFMIMLICMLIPQSLITLKLHTMFDQAAQRANKFAIEKELMVRNEELVGLELTWKVSVAEAADRQDMEALAKMHDKLAEMLENARWMNKHASGPMIPFHTETILNGLNKLEKVARFLKQHKDEPTMLMASKKIIESARKVAKVVEKSMFEIMRIEEQTMVTSYEGSAQTLTDLLYALLSAAAVNFVLLGFLCFVGLRITERIYTLKTKADDFAAGKRLETSLSGSDELQYLDLRLCQVSQAIKDADAQRQKMIAVINHDLRTPLSAIMNGLEMILASGYGEMGLKEKGLVTRAERELNQLLQQINDLLLIEKIDAGLYQLQSEKFEVLPVLAATAQNFRQSANQKRIKLVPAISPDCKDVCVNGDKQLVEREFAIIISNAVKAAPEGSVINVSLERAGDSISVACKDRGPGIDEELLPQIFERFRFVGGKPVTGLGLPLAQRVSNMHGGQLEINSSPAGTETRVLLPIAV